MISKYCVFTRLIKDNKSNENKKIFTQKCKNDTMHGTKRYAVLFIRRNYYASLKLSLQITRQPYVLTV